jgi:hypothetical protein
MRDDAGTLDYRRGRGRGRVHPGLHDHPKTLDVRAHILPVADTAAAAWGAGKAVALEMPPVGWAEQQRQAALDTSPRQKSWAFLAGKKKIQFSLLLPPTKHRMH